MDTVINEFNERVKEVYLYFSFIKDVIEKDARLQFKENGKVKTKQVKGDLIKMLKANFFLILYNLIESSFKKSLEVLCNEISTDTVEFNKIIPEIKKIWIKEHYKNFSKINPNDNPNSRTKPVDYFLDVIEKIAFDIVTIEPSKGNLAGNIGAKEIVETFLLYGISTKPIESKKKNKLHLIKNRRNQLAHGHVSFANCGREFTIQELEEIKTQTVVFMRFILKHIKKELSSKYYRTKY